MLKLKISSRMFHIICGTKWHHCSWATKHLLERHAEKTMSQQVHMTFCRIIWTYLTVSNEHVAWWMWMCCYELSECKRVLYVFDHSLLWWLTTISVLWIRLSKNWVMIMHEVILSLSYSPLHWNQNNIWLRWHDSNKKLKHYFKVYLGVSVTPKGWLGRIKLVFRKKNTWEYCGR